MPNPLKVCICGGGKSAHVMAILAASKPDTEINVLTLYKDEAEKWSSAIENSDMTLTITGADDKTTEVKSKPNMVSKDPSAVVPGSDLVIFAVTAVAHEEYLKAITGHIDKKSVLVGLPGQAGFEVLCKSQLSAELVDQITIMNFELSPWVSEIVVYGQKVNLLNTSKHLNGSILRGKAIPRKPSLMSLQMLLGFDPALQQAKHFMEILFTLYSFMHPVIMYGKWKDWDGKNLSSEPLFFEEIDEDTANLIESCSKEYQDVAHAITAKKPNVVLTEIPDIYNWLLKFYKDDIEDKSSFSEAVKTNKAYKGIKHTMIQNRSKYTPDFQCRDLAEDVPMGIMVVRGIAEMLEVETPCCDMIIEWAQGKLEKKYLVDGKLTGPDVANSRAPQRFGFTTIEEVIQCKKNEEEN